MTAGHRRPHGGIRSGSYSSRPARASYYGASQKRCRSRRSLCPHSSPNHRCNSRTRTFASSHYRSRRRRSLYRSRSRTKSYSHGGSRHADAKSPAARRCVAGAALGDASVVDAGDGPETARRSGSETASQRRSSARTAAGATDPAASAAARTPAIACMTVARRSSAPRTAVIRYTPPTCTAPFVHAVAVGVTDAEGPAENSTLKGPVAWCTSGNAPPLAAAPRARARVYPAATARAPASWSSASASASTSKAGGPANGCRKAKSCGPSVGEEGPTAAAPLPKIRAPSAS